MDDKNYNKLIPQYLDSDFSVSLAKNIDLLRNTESFKDYNYEGSNIRMILELLSYVTDFNTFHTNMLAKNTYMESANIYETVHVLSLLKGYYPKGFVSSYTSVNINLNTKYVDDNTNNEIIYIDDGDQLYIKGWQSINLDDSIKYNTTKDYIITVNNIIDDSVSFDIHMKEGDIQTLSYKYTDIINNKIILPFNNYDHGTYPFTIPSISVIINNEEWIRVNDFYEDVSGLKTVDNVYMFVYDKYNRYYIVFDPSRNIPNETDIIELILLKTKGPDGTIGKNTIDIPDNNFAIYNITKNIDIPVSQITKFTNDNSSIYGSLPENIDEIKIASKANIHSQYRNITSKDYKYHLESRSDIVKAVAFGEQEIDPGNVLEYNKVYISLIPDEGQDSLFIPGTINTKTVTWMDSDDNTLSQDIEIPEEYNIDFRNDVIQFLENRKMLNIYEVFVLPKIVYFRFDIGIRVKRTYNDTLVKEDVKNKLKYFFNRIFLNFNDIISFMDIINFIQDESITSPNNEFKYVKGIDNIIFREIKTYSYFNQDKELVYEPNMDNNTPMYTYESYDQYVDNKLREIKLGFDQYPMLALDMCRFYIEI
jgi:hypothetical protein